MKEQFETFLNFTFLPGRVWSAERGATIAGRDGGAQQRISLLRLLPTSVVFPLSRKAKIKAEKEEI